MPLTDENQKIIAKWFAHLKTLNPASIFQLNADQKYQPFLLALLEKSFTTSIDTLQALIEKINQPDFANHLDNWLINRWTHFSEIHSMAYPNWMEHPINLFALSLALKVYEDWNTCLSKAMPGLKNIMSMTESHFYGTNICFLGGLRYAQNVLVSLSDIYYEIDPNNKDSQVYFVPLDEGFDYIQIQPETWKAWFAHAGLALLLDHKKTLTMCAMPTTLWEHIFAFYQGIKKGSASEQGAETSAAAPAMIACVEFKIVLDLLSKKSWKQLMQYMHKIWDTVNVALETSINETTLDVGTYTTCLNILVIHFERLLSDEAYSKFRQWAKSVDIDPNQHRAACLKNNLPVQHVSHEQKAALREKKEAAQAEINRGFKEYRRTSDVVDKSIIDCDFKAQVRCANIPDEDIVCLYIVLGRHDDFIQLKATHAIRSACLSFNHKIDSSFLQGMLEAISDNDRQLIARDLQKNLDLDSQDFMTGQFRAFLVILKHIKNLERRLAIAKDLIKHIADRRPGEIAHYHDILDVASAEESLHDLFEHMLAMSKHETTPIPVLDSLLLLTHFPSAQQLDVFKITYKKCPEPLFSAEIWDHPMVHELPVLIDILEHYFSQIYVLLMSHHHGKVIFEYLPPEAKTRLAARMYRDVMDVRFRAIGQAVVANQDITVQFSHPAGLIPVAEHLSPTDRTAFIHLLGSYPGTLTVFINKMLQDQELSLAFILAVFQRNLCEAGALVTHLIPEFDFLPAVLMCRKTPQYAQDVYVQLFGQFPPPQRMLYLLPHLNQSLMTADGQNVTLVSWLSHIRGNRRTYQNDFAFMLVMSWRHPMTEDNPAQLLINYTNEHRYTQREHYVILKDVLAYAVRVNIQISDLYQRLIIPYLCAVAGDKRIRLFARDLLYLMCQLPTRTEQVAFISNIFVGTRLCAGLFDKGGGGIIQNGEYDDALMEAYFEGCFDAVKKLYPEDPQMQAIARFKTDASLKWDDQDPIREQILSLILESSGRGYALMKHLDCFPISSGRLTVESMLSKAKTDEMREKDLSLLSSSSAFLSAFKQEDLTALLKWIAPFDSALRAIRIIGLERVRLLIIDQPSLTSFLANIPRRDQLAVCQDLVGVGCSMGEILKIKWAPGVDMRVFLSMLAAYQRSVHQRGGLYDDLIESFPSDHRLLLSFYNIAARHGPPVSFDFGADSWLKFFNMLPWPKLLFPFLKCVKTERSVEQFKIYLWNIETASFLSAMVAANNIKPRKWLGESAGSYNLDLSRLNAYHDFYMELAPAEQAILARRFGAADRFYAKVWDKYLSVTRDHQDPVLLCFIDYLKRLKNIRSVVKRLPAPEEHYSDRIYTVIGHDMGYGNGIRAQFEAWFLDAWPDKALCQRLSVGLSHQYYSYRRAFFCDSQFNQSLSLSDIRWLTKEMGCWDSEMLTLIGVGDAYSLGRGLALLKAFSAEYSAEDIRDPKKNEPYREFIAVLLQGCYNCLHDRQCDKEVFHRTEKISIAQRVARMAERAYATLTFARAVTYNEQYEVIQRVQKRMKTPQSQWHAKKLRSSRSSFYASAEVLKEEERVFNACVVLGDVGKIKRIVDRTLGPEYFEY